MFVVIWNIVPWLIWHFPHWTDYKWHAHSYTECLACINLCMSGYSQSHLLSLFFHAQKSDSRSLGGYSPSTPTLTGTGFWHRLCRLAGYLRNLPGNWPAVPMLLWLPQWGAYKECVLRWSWMGSSFFSALWAVMSVMLFDGHGFDQKQQTHMVNACHLWHTQVVLVRVKLTHMHTSRHG